MTQASTLTPVTLHLTLRGLVQGQGIRPTIARLAAIHGITGTVRNSFRGVEVTASGEPASLQAFHSALIAAFLEASLVAEVGGICVDQQTADFQILESVPGEQIQTTVPVDLAVCSECLRDISSPCNRRFAYPFTACTRCGPRYSILRRMPFDRRSTSMAAFPMCKQCEAEYHDPDNRRFQAQTIACPDCGPHCWATDNDGKPIATPSNAIQFVAARIASGQIAAVKGVGGYQLVCDATNDESVRRLRERKRRPSKPLPVMVSDLVAAEQLAQINDSERKALRGVANPIVVLRAREATRISPALSPHLRSLGLMLPTSPLHAMLADQVGKPIVVTSGNVNGSPLIYQNEIAQEQLAAIADVFLHHDREITQPVDDSVAQCFGDNVMTIRAARGLAPLTISTTNGTPSIAVGGHQKVSPAVGTECDFVLAPHIGDMETESCRIRFQDSVSRLQTLYQVNARQVIRDKHPNYFTSTWAYESKHSTIDVQHHHAHVTAAMLDQGLVDRTVLGVAFDGTGSGDDETIWGGEALLATTAEFARVGHLRCFRLPGGEQAMKHPHRIAQSLLSQLDGGSPVDNTLRYAIDRGPLTSSMGRLFDGVAAMVLDIETVHYEGEAAMRLEAHCDLNELAAYKFSITDDSPVQFDWRSVLAAIQSDMHNLAPERIAMKFHRSVAKLVVEMAARFDTVPCVVTGGVFQNRVLLELVHEMALEHLLDIRLPGKIPVNDGGLAIGQLVVAAARQHQPLAECVKNSGLNKGPESLADFRDKGGLCV